MQRKYSCANEALDDLKRAGLPWKLDLLVITVAEVWVLETDDEKKMEERMEKIAFNAAAKLRDGGLLADTMVNDGAPVLFLLDEAEKLGVDCIFLGARVHHFMDRFLLGSVSAAVTTRATCSVEVVCTVKAASQDAG
jgi:nucleotide-binding universal stress UspA family protein